MKKSKLEAKFLSELNKVPNISLACEKVGLSRNTIYRWIREDIKFEAKVINELDMGVDYVSDLAESKLIANIKSNKVWAIKYWLGNRKKVYIRPRSKDFWESKRNGESKFKQAITFVDFSEPKDQEDSSTDNRVTEVTWNIVDARKKDGDEMSKESD